MARQRRRKGVENPQTQKEQVIAQQRRFKIAEAIADSKRREEARLLRDQQEVARIDRINQIAQEKYSVNPAASTQVEGSEVHPPHQGESNPDET